MQQNMEKQSPKVLGGGREPPQIPITGMKKIHLFIILFSTQNGKFKFKDLNELELELELEQKKLRGRSLAPRPLFSQFKLFTFRQ